MKKFRFGLLIILLLQCQAQGYAQSENMINNAIITPLNQGANPRIRLDTMVIDPVNLFIQSSPTNNDAPNFQLELNIVKNNTEYSTFLWCYGMGNNPQKTNYPKAYQKYSFDLKIENEDVALVIDTLDFGKSMYLDLGQTAVIGNLSILFSDYMEEWSEDINGNRESGFKTYHLSLVEGNAQKTVSFMSRENYDGKEPLIEWKNYKILILDDSEKSLKIMVSKNDS